MPIDSAVALDRRKDFNTFFAAEPIGATCWLSEVFKHGWVSGDLPRQLLAILADKPTPEALVPFKTKILLAGKLLTVPINQFKPDDIRAQGLNFPDRPPAPMVRGSVRLVPTTKELGMRIVLTIGQREFPLVCNDEALECFAGDISAFSGCYDVAVVGWPDSSGQIFVEEAAPLLGLPGLSWSDWAQGRLFDNGVVGGPVVLRVNAQRQILIADAALQGRLRPFIGTGVVLYGKRTTTDDDKVTISDVYTEMWFLTRLSNPADLENGYSGSPRPVVVEGRSLCIGATPPWNWQGPNVETHIVAPLISASLTNTEERRVIFGKPATTLPNGWQNPVNHLTRVVVASACAELPISTVAHWATRLAPRSDIVVGLRGIVELTSAELVFVS